MSPKSSVVETRIDEAKVISVGVISGGGAGFFWTYCGGGGGGGSSYVISSATSVTKTSGNKQLQGNASNSGGAGEGGDRAYNTATNQHDSSFGLGSDGLIRLSW